MSDLEENYVTSDEEISDNNPDSDEEVSSDDSLSDLGEEGAGDNFGLWTNILGEDPGPTPVDFTATPGPKCRLPAATTTPLEYFQLFITDALLTHIVDETNRYANQWIDDHQQYLQDHPKSRVHGWIKYGQTNLEEIKAFLSVVINMGLIKKSEIGSYWETQYESQYIPWFSEHFNRDRFQLLLKFLHFANNAHQPEQNHPNFKLYKVKAVVDSLKARFLANYNPHQDVSIDESMVAYRGRTPHLRQYMPNKHHSRFGIKVWCVCDASTHYTSYIEIFKGAHTEEDTNDEGGITYSLVFRLLREADLLNQGYHIGMDNYFSSPKLFIDLFHEQTTATGTVRSNRKGLPKQLLKKTLRNKEAAERRKGPLLCTVYKDNSKRPILLSTASKGGFQLTTNSRGKELNKPRIVTKYNSSMGGVDTADARLYAYLSERRTMKWTTKLVFALIGRAILNAFILYSEHSTVENKLTRRVFNILLLQSLMGQYRPSKTFRKRRSRAEIAAASEPQAQIPRIEPPDHQYVAAPKNCVLKKIGGGLRRKCMHKHEKEKRTVWQCSGCQVTLCPECFQPWHAERNIRI